MVVTQPFNYGNVLANVEGIKGARTRNELMQQTMQQRTNTLAQQEQLNNALASGDFAAAAAIDPVATQSYSARELALGRERAGLLASAADKVINSANPYQRAQTLLPQLKQAGIQTAEWEKALAGAPTNESIVQGAQALRDQASLWMQEEQQPQIIAGQQAEQLGFQPGTVVQRTDDGFSVLQKPETLTPYQKAQLEQDAKMASGAVLEAEAKRRAANAKTEEGLRKEFNTITKEFREVDSAYGRVVASAENPSAAGDLALIFNYMKMLDPGSTVREGEFATAQNAAGVPSRIVAAYNNVARGERLNDVQRQDFTSRAQKLYTAAVETAQKQAEFYTDIAQRNEVDVANVIGSFQPTPLESANNGGDEAQTLPGGSTIQFLDE